MQSRIQIPDDAKAAGYKQTRPFHHEQMFFSPSLSFTGTEREFLAAGHAYAYVQIDAHTRRALTIK